MTGLLARNGSLTCKSFNTAWPCILLNLHTFRRRMFTESSLSCPSSLAHNASSVSHANHSSTSPFPTCLWQREGGCDSSIPTGMFAKTSSPLDSSVAVVSADCKCRCTAFKWELYHDFDSSSALAHKLMQAFDVLVVSYLHLSKREVVTLCCCRSHPCKIRWNGLSIT